MYPIYKIRLLNINPSSLSNTPPWPGRNIPESFIECFLFQFMKIDEFIEDDPEFDDLDIEGDRLRAFVKRISRYRSKIKMIKK